MQVRTTLLLILLILVSTGLGFGLTAGINAWLSAGVNAGLTKGIAIGLSFGLSLALSLGLSYWLLAGVFQGILSERIEDRERQEPNQGVQRSAQNSLILGITSGVLVGAMGVLSIVLITWLSSHVLRMLGNPLGMNEVGFGVKSAWLLAGSGALLGWTINGGLAVWRHSVLRLLLQRTQTFPGQAVSFLEDATQRILLQRVGGGYQFTHRLLLDYFADLADIDSYDMGVSRQFDDSGRGGYEADL